MSSFFIPHLHAGAGLNMKVDIRQTYFALILVFTNN
jgi:hypothetical protein